MARISICLAIAVVALSMLVALSMSGCSVADDRTLKIYQFQSTDTYSGQFQIDTSQLPPDAIKNWVDSGSKGALVTSLTIDQKYSIRVVLVPVE